jgi:MoaA/NifB/PqqE/SkfB family radical SAM enzyme
MNNFTTGKSTYPTLSEILEEIVSLGLNSAAIREVITTGKWYIEN